MQDNASYVASKHNVFITDSLNFLDCDVAYAIQFIWILYCTTGKSVFFTTVCYFENYCHSTEKCEVSIPLVSNSSELGRAHCVTIELVLTLRREVRHFSPHVWPFEVEPQGTYRTNARTLQSNQRTLGCYPSFSRLLWS